MLTCISKKKTPEIRPLFTYKIFRCCNRQRWEGKDTVVKDININHLCVNLQTEYHSQLPGYLILCAVKVCLRI